LRRIRVLPAEQQIARLKELVARDPDHTASAIMLYIAMREAGVLMRTRGRAPDGSFEHIPRRIMQGIHCPVRYKKTVRHWSRSSFGKERSRVTGTLDQAAPDNRQN
jgi:hypothetical protein